MKKQFYILTIFFFALTMFQAPAAKADGLFGFDWGWPWGWGGGNNGGNNNGGNKGGSTNLPINNGVLFLTIAGIGIGVIMIKKNKAAKVVIKG